MRVRKIDVWRRLENARLALEEAKMAHDSSRVQTAEERYAWAEAAWWDFLAQEGTE